MNMLCNCITFFRILTVTKSFNSPENASILTTARFLQHIEYILGLTSSNNKSMNFFFREKNICLLLASVFLKYCGLKMGKNSALNSIQVYKLF